MPKRVAPLSTKQIDVARKRQDGRVELIDGLVPGLRVRIGTRGNLLWTIYTYDAKGKRRRFKVGENFGLSEARERARKLKRAVADGSDPTNERRQARQRLKDAQGGIGTLRAVIDHYYAHGDGRAKATKANQQQVLRKVFAKHLDRPALDITVSDLQLAAEGYASPSSAAHAIAYLKPLARWAARRGAMNKGFDELAKPIDPDSRAGQLPAIDKDSLVRLLPALEGPHGQAARFMLWTGCRRSEATGARWREFDLDAGLWTISSDRRKDTRRYAQKAQTPMQPHVIPLPRQAVAMLQTMLPENVERDELVFQGNGEGELGNWDRWGKRLAARCGTVAWSRHDFRRTCATIAGELGVEPHVISIILGHKNIGGNQLLGTYNKSRYRPEHAQALQRVADYLEGIESGVTNVIPMRKPA